MCGIAGILKFKTGSVEPFEIHKMTNLMLERGPDDDGIYTNENFGIGFRRLSIIDIDGSHQPISNEDGTLHLVLNGEIYNYKELREGLISRGHIFTTNGDAEVLLHLYEEKGVASIQELNGMFAFALLDNVKKQIWIGRDRFGIKPLFYAFNEGSFYFASTIKAIRAVSKTTINPDALFRCFLLSYSPGDETVWWGVKRLPPAHYILVHEDGRMNTSVYWSLSNSNTVNITEDSALKLLDSHLKNSIALQMRSDVPVGIFLSGGVDSSALLAYASELNNPPIHTFTGNFLNKNSADALMSKRVSGMFGAIHHEVIIDSKIASCQLSELLPYMDEPITDSAIIPAYYLSKVAGEHGVKVLLSGAGADEIFAGYSRHWPSRFGSPAWISALDSNFIRDLLAKLICLIDRNRGLRSSNTQANWGVEISGINLGLIEKLILESNSMDQVFQIFSSQYDGLFTGKDQRRSPCERMLVDLKTYLPGDVLSLMDKASMAASIECRVPFLDHNLVNFAHSLPMGEGTSISQPKGLFKKMLSNKIPFEILDRKKEGFNGPMPEWLSSEVDFNITEELIDNRADVLSEIFDSKFLSELIHKKNSFTSKHYSETFFSIYLINRWVNAQ